MNRSESIVNLASALAIAQGQILPAAKNGTAEVKSKRDGVAGYSYDFSDLASVWAVCRKPLSDNGLSVVQIPEPSPDGSGGMQLLTILMHSSGEFISSALPLYCDDSMQSLGSAITYARRYTLSPMVGIVSESDDDGQAAGSPAPSQPAPAREPSRPQSPPAANGNGNGQAYGPPRKGSQLYAWCRGIDDRDQLGLSRYLDQWGKHQDYPRMMKDWSPDQVSAAYAEALRKIESAESQEVEHAA